MEANQSQPLSPKVALIDADIVLHRVGFTTNNDDFWIAKARANEMLDNILIQTGVEEFELWLSDSARNNFRYQIYPSYKANRTAPKPKWHEELKAHLITEWDARFAEGMEADDYLGILQDEEYGETVICSIDKDLKQIPGLHYDFVKQIWDDVTRPAALGAFYGQIVIGDVSDNIPGARGQGPVAVQKLFSHILDSPLSTADEDVLEAQLFAAVHELYKRSGLKEWGLPWTKEKETAMCGMILLSGRLLKIKRSFKDQLWGSQVLPLMEEYCVSSTLPREEVDIQFMALTMAEKQDGCPLLGHEKDSAPATPDSAITLTSDKQS